MVVASIYYVFQFLRDKLGVGDIDHIIVCNEDVRKVNLQSVYRLWIGVIHKPKGAKCNSMKMH